MSLHIRTATSADASAVDELLIAYARARATRLPGPGQAAERLGKAESLSLAVFREERLVGYGHLWDHGTKARSFARVHPDATGIGVGTLLLEQLEQRARDRSATALDVTQTESDSAGAELLTGRGYRPICYILLMEMALDGYRPVAAPLPGDVAMVPFEDGRDEAGLFAALQAANPTNPESAESWWDDMKADPSTPYDPALWWLAKAGERIVGYALGSRHERGSGTVGYVAEVGVRPERRGQGIAYAVLSRVIAAFAGAGLPKASLSVDADNVTGTSGGLPVPAADYSVAHDRLGHPHET